MPKGVIVGKKPYDRVGKDGKRYAGIDFWMTKEVEGSEGECYAELSVSSETLSGYVPQLGDAVMVSLNKWGRVDEILPIK